MLGGFAGMATLTKNILSVVALATLIGCAGANLWQRIRQPG